MTMIEQSLRELLEDKVVLDVEGIDRLYLNAYQPRLQTGGGVAAFFKGHRGATVASTTLMAPMSRDFGAAIHAFAKRHRIDMVRFNKGERKDDVTRRRLVTSRSLSGEAFRPIWGETRGGIPHRSRRIAPLDLCGMRMLRKAVGRSRNDL
jgi:hypothetical protein